MFLPLVATIVACLVAQCQCQYRGPCQGMGLIIKHGKTSRILVGAHECNKNFTSLSDFTAKPQIQFPGQPTYANYTVMFLSSNHTGGKIKEYRLHWLVANILPIGSTLSPKGTTLAEYWAPTMPPPGRTAVYKFLVYEQKRSSRGLYEQVSRHLRGHFQPDRWLQDSAVKKSVAGLFGSAQFFVRRNLTAPSRPLPPHGFLPPAPGFLPGGSNVPTTSRPASAIGFVPEVYATRPPINNSHQGGGVIGFQPSVVGSAPPAQPATLAPIGFAPVLTPQKPPPVASPNAGIGFRPEVAATERPYRPAIPVGFLPPPPPPPPPPQAGAGQSQPVKNTIVLQPVAVPVPVPVPFAPQQPQQPQQPPRDETVHHHHYVPPYYNPPPPAKKKSAAAAPEPPAALLVACVLGLLAARR